MNTHSALEIAAGIALESWRKYRGPEQMQCLGAVGVRQDGAVVHAHNTYVGSRVEPKTHAEYRLLSRLGPFGTVYVARVGGVGGANWAMAKPCPTCHRAMEIRRVKRVFYTIGPDEYGVWVP